MRVIGFLQGEVRNGCVMVAGVGYVVTCVGDLVEGDDVSLYIHTQVREDSFSLYGFGTEPERRIFARLLKIAGVGPAVALALLRQLGVGAIAAAVRNGEAKELRRAKGVGERAAAAIIAGLEVGDIDEVVEETGSDARAVAGFLSSLGWKDALAFETGKAAVQALPDEDTAARVRWALAQLALSK